ncbi:hypothetical protein A2861_04520 [Candidatus Roizmanbacteria bacterium RIFCSPHIGHO2_01_FULL_38_15]|nr:MAG: hypothetical protein A2861_04520 [Candidatus Roizmanbacteria bacterium RIFCSPHIGHO2_01_FULL_38_15]OGK34975.1 MAG: hypothetical protein A3F59_04600 [Candidatus Roizmanbacteria bacterium RIFCSPHIGHO2_12_FULL_38_13]
MTIKEARKILGKDAINLSDQEIVRDMEMAEFLKNLFFKKLLTTSENNIKNTGKVSLNVP